MRGWRTSHPPQLHSHDRFGRRIDQVEFHPSYHALMTAATGAGLHGTPWTRQGQSPHVARAAGFMLFTELEPSVLCPISMTYAVTPALRGNAAIYADWGPKLASRSYDPALQALARQARPDHGHGHDREAGRLGRPRQHHAGRGRRQRRLGRALPRHRTQVVLLGADVRRLPDPGPGARGADLLLPAARAAGRLAAMRSASSA